MAFDPITTNPGAGGATLAFDTFTDTDAVAKTMPYGAVAVGPLNGPYVPVTATAGLPVVPQTGATWAVTGTFWQATQPVSIAATVIVSGTVTANAGTGTMAVSAASLPLPTGAATAAKQPALGTAGTPSADVLTVQGHAGMTALTVSVPSTISVAVDALNVALDVTNTGTFLVQAAQSGAWAVSLTGTTLAAGTLNQIDYDTGAGVQNMPMVGLALPGNGGAVAGGTSANPLRTDPTGTTTQPVSGTVSVSGNPAANIAQVGGVAVAANSGNVSAGTLRVVLATDQPQLTNKTLVTPDANSTVDLNRVAGTATATGNGTASAGCQRVTVASDNTAFTVNSAQSGTWTVQPGNTANTTPWLFTPAPATSGGPSTSRVKSAATTNATSVKASAGQVYGWYLFNNTASAKFLKFYNKASSPTVGTDTPLFTVPLPANGGANVEYSMGIPFGTGIAYAITGAIGDSDTTSTAADDVHGVILYK